MQIWRNDQLEAYSMEEMHNDISTALKQFLDEQELIYEVLEVDPPQLQRRIWKGENVERKVEFLLRSLEERKEDALASFDFLYPDKGRVYRTRAILPSTVKRDVYRMLDEVVAAL